MRTIKSQDGKMIVNAEKVNRFCVEEPLPSDETTQYENVWKIYMVERTWVKIAEYSTEKRALRVLGLLNEWLIMHEILADKVIADFYDSNDLGSMIKSIKQYNQFIMPQNSEELDA